MGDKTERLLNLIALLLETRRPLTPEEIRAKIPGYPASDVAFRRMFERDKEEIRDLGLPLERAALDLGASEGYRIRRERATIPDLDLSAAERAALSLAAQVWQGQDAPGDPDRALLKLSLASGADEPGGAPWFGVRVGSTPALGVLLDAIDRRKRVTFSYRTGGGAEARERTVDPYALRHRGSWYLAGLDRDRGEVRHFKLDRIEGRIAVAPGREPDFEPPGEIPGDLPRGPWAGEGAGEGGGEARIAFSPDASWWVARRTGREPARMREDGWSEFAIPFDDRALLLSWILGFADDAVVLEPEDLRAEAIERLRRAAGLDERPRDRRGAG